MIIVKLTNVLLHNNNALESAKILAYTSLGRPHVEYAAFVWHPDLERLNHGIDMIQNNLNLKGRETGSEGRERLLFKTLFNRQNRIKHNLLLWLLSNEENHRLLVNDELFSDSPDNTPTTRSMARDDSLAEIAMLLAYK